MRLASQKSAESLIVNIHTLSGGYLQTLRAVLVRTPSVCGHREARPCRPHGAAVLVVQDALCRRLVIVAVLRVQHEVGTCRRCEVHTVVNHDGYFVGYRRSAAVREADVGGNALGSLAVHL